MISRGCSSPHSGPKYQGIQHSNIEFYSDPSSFQTSKSWMSSVPWTLGKLDLDPSHCSKLLRVGAEFGQKSDEAGDENANNDLNDNDFKMNDACNGKKNNDSNDSQRHVQDSAESCDCVIQQSASPLKREDIQKSEEALDENANDDLNNVLFNSDREGNLKRPACQSTSFDALQKSKIRKIPEGNSEVEVVEEEEIGMDGQFAKSSIDPESVLLKTHAKEVLDFGKIVEKWNESKVMSLEVDILKSVSPGSGKNTGQLHSSDNNDAITFDGGRSKLVRCLVCFGSSEVTYISGHKHLTKLGGVLKGFLADNTDELTVIVFDLLKVYRVLRECFGIPKKALFKLKWFDVRIAHWLNDPEGDVKKRRDVHDLVQTYLPTFADLSKKESDSKFYSAAFLFPLANHLNGMILQKSMKYIFEDIETMASLVLAELEFIGMGIDIDGISQTVTSYNEIVKKLENEACRLAERPFNLRSPKQVADVLFHDLNLLSHGYDIINNNPILLGKLKEESKHLTTSKEMLEKLRSFHPLPGLIIEYRNLLSTIRLMESFILYTRKLEDEGHRVCGNIDTFHVTGRISMTNPRLLLSANDTFEITSLKNCEKIDLRKHFVPKPGYTLLSADYSQLELHLLVHFSSDTSLIEALNSGQDVFKVVAASIHCKEIDDVDDEERSQAKAIFEAIRGVGTEKLAENLSVTEEEATEFKNVFLASYPGIEDFLEDVVEDCIKVEVPHIKTISGRLRMLPLMTEGNSEEVAKASRQAVNKAIQGSSSDLIKLSMVNIENVIQSRGLDARLVLDLNDELIFEVRDDVLKEFAEIVSNTMSKPEFSDSSIVMKVKLTVNLKQGPNWSQMAELKLVE